VFLSLLALSSSRALLPRSHVLSAVSFLLLVRAHLPLSSTRSGCTMAPSRSIASRLLIASRRAPPPSLYAVQHCRNQSTNHLGERFRCMSLTSGCIVMSESFVLVIEWQYVANCGKNRRTQYDDDADDDVEMLSFFVTHTHLTSLTLSISPLSLSLSLCVCVCVCHFLTCSATPNSQS